MSKKAKSDIWHNCCPYVAIFTIEKVKIAKDILDKKFSEAGISTTSTPSIGILTSGIPSIGTPIAGTHSIGISVAGTGIPTAGIFSIGTSGADIPDIGISGASISSTSTPSTSTPCTGIPCSRSNDWSHINKKVFRGPTIGLETSLYWEESRVLARN